MIQKSTLALSILQVLLITSLLSIKFTGSLLNLYQPIFIFVCISSFILLLLGYPIFEKLPKIAKQSDLVSLAIQTQFFLHFIILIIFIVDQFYGLDYSSMRGVSPVLMVFFLTATVTWSACFKILNSKIYKLFVNGSRAFLIWTLVLTALGLFYKNSFLSENLHFLFIIYFTIHFAELGFVLLKIQHDLKSIAPP